MILKNYINISIKNIVRNKKNTLKIKCTLCQGQFKKRYF